jgi:hypothetical protein
MEILPAMTYSSYCITKACNTILDLSSLDGTRIGSPEFFTKSLSVFHMKGLRDTFATAGSKTFRYSR